MSPFHAKQLLRAINHNLQLYEKNFGPDGLYADAARAEVVLILSRERIGASLRWSW